MTTAECVLCFAESELELAWDFYRNAVHVAHARGAVGAFEIPARSAARRALDEVRAARRSAAATA